MAVFSAFIESESKKKRPLAQQTKGRFFMPIRYNYDKGETRMESGFSGIRV